MQTSRGADPVTERIIVAAIEVHRTPGPGFEEVFYQRALAREFDARTIDCTREVWIDIHHIRLFCVSAPSAPL